MCVIRVVQAWHLQLSVNVVECVHLYGCSACMHMDVVCARLCMLVYTHGCRFVFVW